jgi:hypothetical protein
MCKVDMRNIDILVVREISGLLLKARSTGKN